MQVGSINIDFLGHSGFLIENVNGERIVIDPYSVSDNVGKVDLILITHSHYDHCSIKDIEKIVKPGTIIMTPADAQSKINKIDKVNMQIIEIGDEIEFGRFKIGAFPAYNVNKSYHPKNEGGLGYVIKIDNVIIYHAGDSDKIKEMENLTGYGKHGNKFIAFLPVSGETVMNVDEAFEVAKMLKPDLVIFMYYGSGIIGTIEEAKDFVELCTGEGINALILEKK
jgi:L-ascorbate metabolism protein UlaG (beta-lactamase superfamily)